MQSAVQKGSRQLFIDLESICKPWGIVGSRVLAVLLEDYIPSPGQNLCAGTGLCGLQGPPVVSCGFWPFRHQTSRFKTWPRQRLDFEFRFLLAYDTFVDTQIDNSRSGRESGQKLTFARYHYFYDLAKNNFE